MNRQTFDAIIDRSPKYNPKIANNFALEQVKGMVAAIERVWNSAANDLPEGLTFDGVVKGTPEDIFRVMTTTKEKRSYEMSDNSLFLVKYKLKFDGVELGHKGQFLPYLEEAGTFKLNSVKYLFSPTLSDDTISVCEDALFVQLSSKNKINFNRMQGQYKINGVFTNSTIVYSTIHRHTYGKGEGGAGGPRNKTTVAHYLFGKYGLYTTFQRFGANVKVGTRADLENTLNKDEWYICTTSGIAPQQAQSAQYMPSDIAIAVKVTEWTDAVSSMIAGFFYVVDRFPDRIHEDNSDSKRIWKILLGKIIFYRGDSHDGKKLENIETHYLSLDTYVDNHAVESFKVDLLEINDIYDLFVEIIETMQTRIRTENTATMYGKQLMVLRYLLEEITNSINNFVFSFNGRKATGKPIDERFVKKMMYAHLMAFKFLSIKKSTGSKKKISTAPTPSGCPALDLSTKICLQNTPKGLNDPSSVLDESIPEVGNYGKQPPYEATGRAGSNAYANIDDLGRCIRRERFRPLLNMVGRAFSRD